VAFLRFVCYGKLKAKGQTDRRTDKHVTPLTRPMGRPDNKSQLQRDDAFC